MKLDFCEVFDDYTSRCRKIPKEEYLSNGKYIVIDQGKNSIAGYTNVDDGLFEDVPAIVFGDHTRIIKYVDEPFFLGADGVKLLKSKINGANYKYLYYVLSNEKIPDTGYNRHFKWLKEISLEYKDVESQKKIVRTLDSVTKIIELCKIELRKLDNLIKARFVESFGNPVLNNKGWEQKILGDITLKIGSGATPKGGKRVYKENGIAFIRSMNVHSGYFEYRDLAYISDEQAHRLDNVTVEEYDVLLNITGASVARCCMIPSDILPARVNQHVCIIRCKQDILSYFLNYLLMENNFQELLLRIAETGATREAITKQQIENLNIIVPPIQLQNEFATFVKQVNKSKFPTLHNHKSIYTKSQLCCKMVIVNVFLNTKRFWINKTLRIFSLR